MDILDLVLPLVIHWRIGLSVVAAPVVGGMLAFVFAWFTGLHVLLLAILGVGIGMLWDASPRPPSRRN